MAIRVGDNKIIIFIQSYVSAAVGWGGAVDQALAISALGFDITAAKVNGGVGQREAA